MSGEPGALYFVTWVLSRRVAFSAAAVDEGAATDELLAAAAVADVSVAAVAETVVTDSGIFFD